MSRELRYERLLQASPERVFDLCTSPAGRPELYGNDAPGWIVDSRCELRIGGAREIAFGPSPGELYRPRSLMRRRSLATATSRSSVEPSPGSAWSLDCSTRWPSTSSRS